MQLAIDVVVQELHISIISNTVFTKRKIFAQIFLYRKTIRFFLSYDKKRTYNFTFSFYEYRSTIFGIYIGKERIEIRLFDADFSFSLQDISFYNFYNFIFRSRVQIVSKSFAFRSIFVIRIISYNIPVGYFYDLVLIFKTVKSQFRFINIKVYKHLIHIVAVYILGFARLSIHV